MRRAIPKRLRSWLRAKEQAISRWPPVRMGALRRTSPVSRLFGLDRGQSIDRFYIEDFLRRHSETIRGHVLEIGDDAYTRAFGGDRVSKSDVLHVTSDNAGATIVADLSGDLATDEGIFDCIILTQTLQFIFELRRAIANLLLMLKPGGVLLGTLPGISQISRYDMDRWGEFWRFTSLSAGRLFAEAFGKDNVFVESHGNVLSATGFLHGLSAEEFTEEELRFSDPDYEVIVTVRAEKAI